MKKIENSFAVTGFVGKDADIRNFDNASVARFAIVVRRGEKDSEDSASAFLSVETWRKNPDLSDFNLLKKGKMITLEGFFKPEEWTDAESGQKRNRVTLVATKVYATPDVAEEKPAQAPDPEPQPEKKSNRVGGKR